VPHTTRLRRTRRALGVGLTLTFVVVLVAAGWTRYSSAASASAFASPVRDDRVLASRHGALAAPRADWATNGAEGGTHYSALDEISPANVDSLQVAWVFRTGDVSDGAADSSGPATAFEATPLMLDGTLYIATPSARVIALDPERGTPRWTYDAHLDRASLAHNEVTTRGVSAWVDSARASSMPCRTRIFVATFDARLIALDGRTGAPCTDFGTAGTIDLHAGVRGADRLAYEYHVTSPPAVIDDLVIIGSSIFDNLHAQAPSGLVRAFDARTGALRWGWEPLRDAPAPDTDSAARTGERFRSGAGNAWGLFAVDLQRDLVFIPTGSPSPDHFGGMRPGPNANANSIVALRGSTGKLVWSFQLVHHDLWDYDAAAQPVLTTVERDGISTAVVMQASKTGAVFVLDRDTGVPVFPVTERGVPASDVAGEHASATQPFPSTPAVVPQGLRPSDAWGLTAVDRNWCARRIRSLRSDGIFTPPSLGGSIEFPGFLGGVNWGGIGVDRPRGIAIMNTIRVATVVTLLPPDSIDADARAASSDAAVARQDGAPYGSRRELLRSPLGLPCNAPPWGTIVAIDLDDGHVVWEKPLGTMSDFAHLPAPRSWGSPSLGGPLVTSAGLVIIAAAMDHHLRAFDTRNGEQLWEVELPASAQATPMTYRVRPGGRQYIVIAAGGHHLMHTRLGDYLIAYALP
jgi:quinoprotein glucose dehydrogenase